MSVRVFKVDGLCADQVYDGGQAAVLCHLKEISIASLDEHIYTAVGSIESQ